MSSPCLERVPGVYAEYTYKHLEMLTLMAGYRVDYDRNTEQTLGNPYGIDVNTNRFEAFSKTGYIFDRPSTSLGWINAFTYHDQTSNYGPRAYDATQNSYHLS